MSKRLFYAGSEIVVISLIGTKQVEIQHVDQSPFSDGKNSFVVFVTDILSVQEPELGKTVDETVDKTVDKTADKAADIKK